jgi:hypothetical protein
MNNLNTDVEDNYSILAFTTWQYQSDLTTKTLSYLTTADLVIIRGYPANRAAAVNNQILPYKRRQPVFNYILENLPHGKLKYTVANHINLLLFFGPDNFD